MNNNIPAFPLEYPHPTSHSGMTLLDYFAGLAMQGDMANGSAENIVDNSDTYLEAANKYYDIAGAMLKARLNYQD